MSSSGPPTLTSRQAKQVDTLAQERFGIPVDWLMEAAGWQVARFCDRPAMVICGVGNNAGDGLAAARHLHRWGRLTGVCCVDAQRLKGPAARELEALQRVGVHVSSELRLGDGPVVVDALFGTGLTRAPEGRFAEWIDVINTTKKRVISIDVPSGLDADTGVAYAPTVRADITITLGLPKAGLLTADGPHMSGDVFIADIGVPSEAYAALGISVPPDLFGDDELVRM